MVFYGREIRFPVQPNPVFPCNFFIFRLEMYILRLKMCVLNLKICILSLRMKKLPA